MLNVTEHLMSPLKLKNSLYQLSKSLYWLVAKGKLKITKRGKVDILYITYSMFEIFVMIVLCNTLKWWVRGRPLVKAYKEFGHSGWKIIYEQKDLSKYFNL